MKEVMQVACMEDENAPILAKEDPAKRPFERFWHRWKKLKVK
jgi:hypothetical protein